MTRPTFDALVIGSGINGLVCAAMLGRKGHKVAVLERNSVPGGCIRTDQITLPGFVHDVLSGFHPLFVTSPAYRALGADLHARGLDYANDAIPTGVLMPDGRWSVLERDRAANIARFNAHHSGDGAHFDAAMNDLARDADFTFALLGQDLATMAMARRVAAQTWQKGIGGMIDYAGSALSKARDWLESGFASAELRALLAPWVLHTGLGPDSPASGFMAGIIAFTLEAAGMPVVRGGSAGVVDAFARLIRDQGGTIICDADVTGIRVEGKRATGVDLADGRSIDARRAIFASVTPKALYQRLLPAASVPPQIDRAASAFRHGRADMQIHLALDRPVSWPSPELARTTMVHLTGGIDDVALAVGQADAGLLPIRPTVVIGQPAVPDPSRVPDGKGLLWIQLQELPREPRGDAAGLIDVGGGWDDRLTQAYADRVMAHIERFLPGLGATVLKRVVVGPRELEAYNCNLVGGDPYSGDCALDQSFLWRPGAAMRNHHTCVKGLYHIGASTHPGPGLAGTSGFIAAQYL